MLPKKMYGNHSQKKTKYLFKVLCFVSAIILFFLTCLTPISAETTITLYAIYDGQNNNNIIGYYSVRALPSTPPVYDLGNVYILNTSGVISNATSVFLNDYSVSHDFTLSQDESLNYLKNYVSIESNQYLGTSLQSNICSWLNGYITSNFLLYQGVTDNYLNLVASYQTTLDNATSQAYQNGLNAGLTQSQDASYNQGYDEGYDDGYTSGIAYANNQNQTDTSNAYLNGYSDGVDSSNGVMKYIYAFFSAPFVYMSNLFNFKLFGIDFYQIVLTLLTLVLVFWVVKFIVSRVS